MKKFNFKNKQSKEMSFGLSMFWFAWATFCIILGQLFNKSNRDITYVLTLSIGTLICAPLSYYLVNKSFKNITIDKYCVLVIPLYFILMLIIILLLCFAGIIVLQ